MTLYLLKIVRLELLTHKASPPPPFPLGCSEALMVGAVTSEAVSVAGKESLSMDAYARALMMIPTTISDNAGYDSAQVLAGSTAVFTVRTRARARLTQGENL